MPMGLGDAIKKRTSGEFKMEVSLLEINYITITHQ